MVGKEMWTCLLAYNLIRQTMLQATSSAIVLAAWSHGGASDGEHAGSVFSGNTPFRHAAYSITSFCQMLMFFFPSRSPALPFQTANETGK